MLKNSNYMQNSKLLIMCVWFWWFKRFLVYAVAPSIDTNSKLQPTECPTLFTFYYRSKINDNVFDIRHQIFIFYQLWDLYWTEKQAEHAQAEPGHLHLQYFTELVEAAMAHFLASLLVQFWFWRPYQDMREGFTIQQWLILWLLVLTMFKGSCLL